MSGLLKESIIRASLTTKKLTDLISIDGNDAAARAFQIIEINEWLENALGGVNSFSSKYPGISREMDVHTFSEKIIASTGLPCSGIVKQMIRHHYFQRPSMPTHRNQLNDPTLSMSLSASFWVVCTSSFKELLVFLFGIYDVYNENALDRECITSLLSDIFSLNSEHAPKINNSVKITEIVDELFEHAYAKSCCSMQPVRKSSFDSIGSFDSVADMRSTSNEIAPKISCKDFVHFTFKKGSGILWPLISFQKKLQESSFGEYAWSIIVQWCQLKSTGLNVNENTFINMHRILEVEVAKNRSFREEEKKNGRVSPFIEKLANKTTVSAKTSSSNYHVAIPSTSQSFIGSNQSKISMMSNEILDDFLMDDMQSEYLPNTELEIFSDLIYDVNPNQYSSTELNTYTYLQPIQESNQYDFNSFYSFNNDNKKDFSMVGFQMDFNGNRDFISVSINQSIANSVQNVAI